MSKVERYFHIRLYNPIYGFGDVVDSIIASRGGATIHVIGGTDVDEVMVQVSFCSANDAFCRKTGREVAEKHPMHKVPLSHLPGVLQTAARTVCSRVLKLSHKKRTQHPLWDADYSFSTKYFQEKKPTA